MSGRPLRADRAPGSAYHTTAIGSLAVSLPFWKRGSCISPFEHFWSEGIGEKPSFSKRHRSVLVQKSVCIVGHGMTMTDVPGGSNNNV